MNPQVEYAVKQALAAAGIGAIPVVIAFLYSTFGDRPEHQAWLPFAVAVLGVALTSLKRVREGQLDGIRADKGQVIPADVPQTIKRRINEDGFDRKDLHLTQKGY